MTFEEIDRSLSSWNQRLAAIADNLLELQRDPTYQVLTGSGGTTPLVLTGETARQVLPALKPVESIFHQFSLLQAAIDRAIQLRKDLPQMFGRDQALREIEALLLGESIQLPADALPLKDRTLLSGAPGTLKIRPEQLLAIMAKAYSEACNAVLAVSSTWDELAHQVDPAETELRRLLAESENAGPRPQALTRAEKSLGLIKESVQSDPLTARNELRTQLLPALVEAAREQHARLRLKQQITAAHRALERLPQLERDLEAAAALNREKISGAPPTIQLAQVPPSESLAAWLGRLEGRHGDERPETIARGLDNWQQALNKAVEANVKAIQQERAPLERRGELRGRLDALKAKARKYGVAEDGTTASLAGHAEVLLYARPTDLAQAAAAVEAYERRLAAPAPAGQPPTGSNEEHR